MPAKVAIGQREWTRPVDVLRCLSSDAVVVAGYHCAPFWAGTYGPTQVPVEVEVIAPAEEAAGLPHRLEGAAPDLRWNVRSTGLLQKQPRDLDWTPCLAHEPLVALCGGIHAATGLRVWGHAAAHEHLKVGLLEPNGSAPESAASGARRLLQAYPGLRAPFLGYGGKTVEHTLTTIMQQVADGETGGRPSNSALRASERPVAAEIIRWHREATPSIEPVPVPIKAKLPTSDPWSAPDSEFREWLLDQTMVRSPLTQPDEALQRMLAAQRGDQKPTHQGWEIAHHGVMAALVLETTAFAPTVRPALRVAAILHDVGKTLNLWTPGCHALIGAKIWDRWAPAWLSPEEKALITGLIAVHDILGLLDRAIMHEAYPGGLFPEDVRGRLHGVAPSLPEALRLASAMYRADIGSVAALRWLLPVTPLLERIVLAECAP